MDGVAGKELFELAVELCGKGFVVGEDERGALDGLDDVGHRESFARAGDAHQDLVTLALAESAEEGVDGLRLIAGGLERGGELELHRARNGKAGWRTKGNILSPFVILTRLAMRFPWLASIAPFSRT